MTTPMTSKTQMPAVGRAPPLPCSHPRNRLLWGQNIEMRFLSGIYPAAFALVPLAFFLIHSSYIGYRGDKVPCIANHR